MQSAPHDPERSGFSRQASRLFLFRLCVPHASSVLRQKHQPGRFLQQQGTGKAPGRQGMVTHLERYGEWAPVIGAHSIRKASDQENRFTVPEIKYSHVLLHIFILILKYFLFYIYGNGLLSAIGSIFGSVSGPESTTTTRSPAIGVGCRSFGNNA